MGNLQLAWEMLEVAKVIYKRYVDIMLCRVLGRTFELG